MKQLETAFDSLDKTQPKNLLRQGKTEEDIKKVLNEERENSNVLNKKEINEFLKKMAGVI